MLPAITPLERYQQDPSPGNLSKVVDDLRPTIEYGLSSLQASDDPYMRSKARTIVGAAVQKFDPSKGASLPTWVTGQLQQLHRIRRQSQGPVKLPDRAMLDNMALTRAERVFADSHGRDPDMVELADATSIPIRRIREVRKLVRRMPSAEAVGDSPMVSGLDDEDPSLADAADTIYRSSDLLDRKIMELKTGFGGGEALPPHEVAKRLGLDPWQLTRRSQRLALRLQQAHNNIKAVYSS